MFIVTLSSIPSRFSLLQETLARLSRQNQRPDHIVVYLPRRYRRFPDYDGQIPEVPKGVEVRVVEEDFGPATKLLPALQDFSGQDLDILFCDDDMDYRPQWTSWFLRERQMRPNDCLSLVGFDVENPGPDQRSQRPEPRVIRSWHVTDVEHKFRKKITALGARYFGAQDKFVGRRAAWRAGYSDTFMGFGGVMVRPNFFGPEVFDIPPECWAVDDIWLSGMAAKNGHHAWIIANRRFPDSLILDVPDSLTETKIDGVGRDVSNANAVRYLRQNHGVWM